MLDHNIETDMQHKRIQHPLVMLYTGNGKGKTTAAMGLLFRALGHGGSCAVLQFIKPPTLDTGEKRMAMKLGIPWENFGTGFLWDEQDDSRARAACAKGWVRAQELIKSGTLDLVVLDEFTYVLDRNFVAVADVMRFLADLKQDPAAPHVVITGRNAPQDLVEACDMAHELVEVKHPWRTRKIAAQPMIEY